MKYDGTKIEVRDREREAIYDETHLADCREIKCYKLTPEEVATKYGCFTGSGQLISPLVRMPRKPKKEEIEDMSNGYSIAEYTVERVIDEVKQFMDKLGIEHVPSQKDFASHKLEGLRFRMQRLCGGASGLSARTGILTKREWNNRQPKEVEVVETNGPEVIAPKVYIKAIELDHENNMQYHLNNMRVEHLKKQQEIRALDFECDKLIHQIEGFMFAAEIMGVELE